MLGFRPRGDRGGRGQVAILAALVLVLMIAACGTSSTPAPAKGVNIVFWSWKFTQAPFKSWINWAQAEYQKSHPNVTFTQFTSGDLATEVQAAVAGGGTVPDLVETDGVGYERTLAQAGDWVDLKTFIDADPAWGAWTKKVWSSIPLFQYTDNGHVIAAPISGGPAFVYYWKDLFAQAGATPPQTMDDLLALPAKFKNIHVDVMGVGMAPPFQENEVFWAIASNINYDWAASHNAANCSQKYSGDPVAKQSLEMMLQLYRQGVFRKQALQEKQDPDAKQLFAQKKVAMLYPSGTWNNGLIATDAGNVGVIVWPRLQAGGPATIGNSYDVGIGVLAANAAQKDPAHKAAVVDYVKFLTSAASQQQLWKSGLFPLDSTAAANAGPGVEQVTAAQVQIAGDPKTKPVFYTSIDSRVHDTLGPSGLAMLAGQKTPDQVLSDLDAACAKSQ